MTRTTFAPRTLHWSRSDVATFMIQDEATTYRYRSGSPSAARAHTRLDIEPIDA